MSPRKNFRKKRSGQRKPKKNILIICQGERTEKEYFERLRAKLRASGIKVHPLAKDPYQMVQTALRMVDSDDLDHVYIVADVDETSQAQLERAASLCRKTSKNSIQLVISNPSFDAWLHAHFKPTGPTMNQKSIENYLREQEILIGGKRKGISSAFPIEAHGLARKQIKNLAFGEYSTDTATAVPLVIDVYVAARDTRRING